MGKAALIDIRDGWDGKEAIPVYIFSSRGRRYEFERTVELSVRSSLPDGIDGSSEICLSLPLSFLNFRMMKFPFREERKLRDVIPYELDGLILAGSGNVVFDQVVLGPAGNDDFDVLVTFADKKVLGDILSRLGSMNLDPQTVTSLELRGALNRRREDLGSYLIEPEELRDDGRIEAAAQEISAPTINLRTGAFARTKDAEKTKKALKMTAVLSFLLALTINADLGFRFITAKREAASLRKEIRSFYSGFFPADRKITDELSQMKSRLKELREKGDVMAGVHPLRFLMDLSRRTLTGVRIDEFDLGRELITVKGEARSIENVDEMKSRLSEFLKDAEVPDIKTSVEGRTRFTIVAKGYK